MNTCIVIPARYGSTRFHGKAIARLNGIPMVKYVAKAAGKSGLPVYIATDDDVISSFADVVYFDQFMYNNGTERVAGAMKWKELDKYEKFINVQCDMPDVTVECIEKCVELLDYYPVSTVYTDMPEEQKKDPNSVKLVRADSKACWFGRGITGYGEWHLGVYGYRRSALWNYPHYGVSEEETIEGLEQLRWLKNEVEIGVAKVKFDGIEINTHEDLEMWHKRNRI